MKLPDAIASFTPELPIAIAFSGGADSTALLLACARKWPGHVHAIHIHHGLQAAANGFAQHCAQVCGQLGVPLVIRRVDAGHRPGQSPEDAARRARYGAIEQIVHADMASAAIKNIAIGQHADDQVETVLLALSRGAGLPGLAAMPARWQRNGLTYHRPFLRVPASEIRTWLAGQAQGFVEDPSNSEQRFTRNRIRSHLLPALQQVFPHFRDTFARAASHAAQAQDLMRELAAQDLASVGNPPQIKHLQTLSRARQANLIRHWLMSTFQTVPSAAQLEELLDQLAACTTRGHNICIKVGTGLVARSESELHWYNR